MVTRTDANFVYAAELAELAEKNCLTARVEGHTLVLFKYGQDVFAVDNRCPHMGFPLNQGTVQDGILTCHWHHARFDLKSGGTFDQWADDVRSFPVAVRDGQVYVDLGTQRDVVEHQQERLQVGLERNISLVLAKSALALLNNGVNASEPYRLGVDFGVNYRAGGWGQGLTIHTCMMNLLPYLQPEDRARALYHGLSAVADDTDGMPPRFIVRPLPTIDAEIPTLKRWFRQFIEVRDAEGAERCVTSAIRAGATMAEMADMLFAAATDYRYITIGHPLDFTNKAFEALDAIGWEYAELVLTSIVNGYANGSRMEESNSWRYPVDLIAILDAAFGQLGDAVEAGADKHSGWDGRTALVETILRDDPQATAGAMLDALRDGCSPVELASAVTFAAAMRVAQFHTSNEFGDWDTALHTFTFANAVQHGLVRIGSDVPNEDGYTPLLRGVFDAAMSVYLDRFLNIPAAKLPAAKEHHHNPTQLLDDLTALLNRQQQVNEAADVVARYLFSGGKPEALLATLGRLLLREDRDFHTIQMVEAAIEQYALLRGTADANIVLIAAARYLAAHSPTMRSQGQTYSIAQRLARGEALYEGD